MIWISLVITQILEFNNETYAEKKHCKLFAHHLANRPEQQKFFQINCPGASMEMCFVLVLCGAGKQFFCRENLTNWNELIHERHFKVTRDVLSTADDIVPSQ